jgi:hypothetical protein
MGTWICFYSLGFSLHHKNGPHGAVRRCSRWAISLGSAKAEKFFDMWTKKEVGLPGLVNYNYHMMMSGYNNYSGYIAF